MKLDCEMLTLSEENTISGFDCGDDDLNEFFNHDALAKKAHVLKNMN